MRMQMQIYFLHGQILPLGLRNSKLRRNAKHGHEHWQLGTQALPKLRPKGLSREKQAPPNRCDRDENFQTLKNNQSNICKTKKDFKWKNFRW